MVRLSGGGGGLTWGCFLFAERVVLVRLVSIRWLDTTQDLPRKAGMNGKHSPYNIPLGALIFGNTWSPKCPWDSPNCSSDSVGVQSYHGTAKMKQRASFWLALEEGLRPLCPNEANKCG